jgi:adenine-specific DNA-methyltransferase
LLPTDQISFRAHAFALKPKQKGARLTEEAETLAKVVLNRWQQLAFPELWMLGERNSFSLTSNKKNKDIDSFVDWLIGRPLLESAFWLSSAFALWVEAEVRSTKAMFFTPPILAERLIDSLLMRGASFDGDIWHDPAGGGGAFIAPLADRFCRKLIAESKSPSEILMWVSTCITAIELDPTLGYLASEYVNMILSKQIRETGEKPELQIFQADTLAYCQSNVFDVVICNPPYRKLNSEEIYKYKFEHADVIAGQSNLYGLFMKRCIQLLKEDGLVGLVTPTSFVSGLHFKKLRKYLLSNSELLQIDFIQERSGIFIGVEQGAVATVFQKKLLQKSTQKLTGSVVSNLYKGRIQTISTVYLDSESPVWMIPRKISDLDLVRHATKCRSTISDYGYVIRIGNFVAYRDTRTTYTKESLPKNGLGIYPLIWAADINANRVLRHGQDGAKRGDVLYVKNDPSNLFLGVEATPSIAIQRVTSPDQKRRLIAAPVPRLLINKWGGVIGENHVVFLVPAVPKPILNTAQMVKLISSSSVDILYRCMSGAVNISAHELNNLPLPCPENLKTLQSKKPLTDDLIYEAYSMCK